jgi:CMP/dCMP kinase
LHPGHAPRYQAAVPPDVSATPIVAIDGPAGAGKSTVARQLAQRLGFSMIDTGAIYRSVALAARHAEIGWDDDPGLAHLLAHGLPLTFRDGRVLLAGEDVTDAIRDPEITRGASVVSARGVVRERLLELQRDLGRSAAAGAVLEGRDIGTVVFPDADVKFFLTATDEARALRRHAELSTKGHTVVLSEVLVAQRLRDKDDTERAIAPLKPAADAIVIDTTGLDLGEVVERCFQLANARLSRR